MLPEDSQSKLPDRTSPVGIFDSGVGGLSVFKAIRHELPEEKLIYLADQAHVPYGSRPLIEVREFSEAISAYLIQNGAKLIVVACNTASAAALQSLREKFPNTPFVGMEPAVKPAVENTQSRVVGVLATPATFQGALYASVVERFANGVTLLTDTCPELVNQIENGEMSTPATQEILERALKPMLEQGIDTVVLGCTHYPFVIPQIRAICGPNVRVIDPAPAVARQVRRRLEQHHLLAPVVGCSSSLGQGEKVIAKILTSGSTVELERQLPILVGESWQTRKVFWGNQHELSDQRSE
jgi:glutamate racemase